MRTFPPISRLGRRLYKQIYGESLPQKWQIKWVPFIREQTGYNRQLLGVCSDAAKTIQLAWDNNPPKGRKWGFLGLTGKNNWNGPFLTLIHEFVHQRHPELMNHGKKFRRYYQATVARLSHITI